MNVFPNTTLEEILRGKTSNIEQEVLNELVVHPRACVETEFPHHVWSVESPDERIRPSVDHPIFYGC